MEEKCALNITKIRKNGTLIIKIQKFSELCYDHD